jgi:hypothetical protein
MAISILAPQKFVPPTAPDNAQTCFARATLALFKQDPQVSTAKDLREVSYA